MLSVDKCLVMGKHEINMCYIGTRLVQDESMMVSVSHLKTCLSRKMQKKRRSKSRRLEIFQEDFLPFPESGTMSSRSPVTYTRSPTAHDKDDPVVIKVLSLL